MLLEEIVLKIKINEGMDMEKIATLADIAQKMGVSIVTVSNALSEKKGVSDELRSKIIKTAQELGYKKRTKRTSLTERNENSSSGERIGVLINERFLGKYTSFYWEMYQRVVFEASRKGCFILLEVISMEKEEKLVMPGIVEEKQIDGLIIMGPVAKSYMEIVVESAKIPVVSLDSYEYSLFVDSVISNGYFGMYQMTNYLLNAGHKEIAFVGTRKATSSIMDRYLGYSKALLERGIEEKKEWILSDRNIHTGKMRIQLPEKMPTAFACNCDLTAEELVCLLEEKGYRIPEDISIVGYDDFLEKGRMKNKITTYAVDMDMMAHEAVKLILKRLKNEFESGKKILKTIDGKMVIRVSVRNINKDK